MITRTMIEKILEFAREPGINGYGKWGSLNVEQRKLVRELCKSWIIYDDATNRQTKEIERLKELIKTLYFREDKYTFKEFTEEQLELLNNILYGSDKE